MLPRRHTLPPKGETDSARAPADLACQCGCLPGSVHPSPGRCFATQAKAWAWKPRKRPAQKDEKCSNLSVKCAKEAVEWQRVFDAISPLGPSGVHSGTAPLGERTFESAARFDLQARAIFA